MNNTQPLVSIVIPVYNGANYVCRAIDSALAQTYPNTEIIVVNDGSTDGGETDRLVKAYGNKVRYFCKANGGVSSALNFGIREMKGEYFSWLSHDDEYDAKKVEMQVKLLTENGCENCLALCGTEFIDADGNRLSKSWNMPAEGIHSPERALFEMKNNPLSGIALLIPKKALTDGGLFDESLRYIQDADLWRKIFLNGYSLIVDNAIYAKSRLHNGQQTNLHRERFKEEMERTAFDFSKRCFECGYYELVRVQWYSLLKKNIPLAAKQTKQLMKQEGLLDLRTIIKGSVYAVYGKIRPLIRYIYYKICYRVTSKG